LAISVEFEFPIIPVRHEFFVITRADGLGLDLLVVCIPDAMLSERPTCL